MFDFQIFSAGEEGVVPTVGAAAVVVVVVSVVVVAVAAEAWVSGPRPLSHRRQMALSHRNGRERGRRKRKRRPRWSLELAWCRVSLERPEGVVGDDGCLVGCYYADCC